MIRLLLSFLLPLFLPFIVYALWDRYKRWQAAARGLQPPDLKGPPLLWLGVTGVLLVLLVLLILDMPYRQGVAGRYAPPHLDGGRIVPGAMK